MPGAAALFVGRFIGPFAGRRLLAALAAGALLPPALAACGGAADGEGETTALAHAVAEAPRSELSEGGRVTWGVDSIPATLDVHDPAATPVTRQVAAAVLPVLFPLDAHGSPRPNTDYLRAAEVTAREPRQRVVYTLNPRARWSDGTRIGAADFRAQWRDLAGTAAGYDRIAGVTAGPGAHQVTVAFAEPYAEWRSLFSPLYPRAVTEAADREGPPPDRPPAAGPFRVAGLDRESGTLTLRRNDAWWGERALLDELVFAAVPADERQDALLAGEVDVAAVGTAAAARIAAAHAGPDRARRRAAAEAVPPGDLERLRRYEVYRAYGAGYTRLTMNGDAGPLRDERVRWALARALDRSKLAADVHAPAGLPTRPLGSHLRLLGQAGYRDTSHVLGERGRRAAAALLDEAGWRLAPGVGTGTGTDTGDGGTGGDGKPAGAVGRPAALAPLAARHHTAAHRAALLRQAAHAAPAGDADADAERVREAEEQAEDLARQAFGAVRAKDGRSLTLRLRLPGGTGETDLRRTARRIAAMLDDIGVRTETATVPAEEFFAETVPGGDFDLALYSWPATAYPATEAAPLFTKPRRIPGAGRVLGLNHTGLGTDYLDQLLAQAAGELDEDEYERLLTTADERIWALAGAVPLYQRPELVAARTDLAGVGAHGMATPRFEDIGYRS